MASETSADSLSAEDASAGSGAAGSLRTTRPNTPLSIIGMSGLKEIVAVSSGLSAIYLLVALAVWQRPLETFGLFAAGLFVWTFLEYILHRWMLHWEPEERWKRLVRKCFPSHRSHHDAPLNERKNIRLQLKIVVYMMVFWTAVAWVVGFPLAWVMPFYAGVIIGYQMYEYVHVACHHLPMRNAWAALLKRHHAIHHHRDETVNFGVTTTIWDSVFGTTYRPERQPA